MSSIIPIHPSNTSNCTQSQTAQSQTKSSSEQQSAKQMKADKKLLAYSVAAAAGVAVLAGLIIHKIKSGKASDLVDEGQKTAENIKQFFNKDNQLIDGVTLQKGRALNADGSAFSGIMNTVNKKGDEFTIEYLDGFITSSSRNGKLLKKFENIDNLAREQGVQITKFNDKGLEETRTVITNYDNGKVKRIFKDPKVLKKPDEYNIELSATEFTPDGKLAAKAQYNQKCVLKKAQIYDEKGNLTREMGQKHHLETSKSHSGKYIEKTYDKNGKLMMVKSAKDNYYNGGDARTYMLSENKLYEPESIKFFNADGSFNKSVRVESGHKDQIITICDKDGNAAELQEKLRSDENSYFGTIQGDEDVLFSCRGNIKLNKRAAEGLSKDELKQQIEKTANELEEAFGIMQKEGMPYLQGLDSEFNQSVHIDVPTIIEQMRNFIKSL